MADIPLKSIQFPGLSDIYIIPQITELGDNIPNNSNIDELIIPGKYYVADESSAATILGNPPTKEAGYSLIVMKGNADSVLWQFAFYSSNNILFRYKNDTEWNGWERFNTNILTEEQYGLALPESGVKGQFYYKKV